ncbi:hypothetical protein SE23_05675 [Vibrio sinaloensis]|uniref:NifB/NifX family molybdenum-iron cluster-binding protein n=1 Tax=Photobacterium sp. (strain ATCC 43367) TaxID=379097 RepID=UPI000580ADB4|nr:NifB/NifX family molybdenum-iron cluster-binding protein [Vibrio sinaloensis]KIE21706.1 hypothetical protein SE23_05675 [Vibrio sinaloensis]
MIYAVPCNSTLISNHFSRCEQIAIIDSITHQTQYLSIAPDTSCCSVKKKWLRVIDDYKVDVVVVRNIGQNMLKGLFQSQVTVLAAKVKLELRNIHFAELMPVESLDYGRVSPKKKTCGNSKNATLSLAPPQSGWHSIRRVRR